MTLGTDHILPRIALRALFSMQLAVDAIVSPGGPSGAGRRIGPITEGIFEGERLRGTILPGGEDWQTERGDGAILLDARILLRTDDDALVAMTYTGIRHGSQLAMAALARGEVVDPASYYFRIVAHFSTSDGRYEWLNRIIAVGTGDRAARGPNYLIYEII